MAERTEPARALVTGASGGLGAALARRLAFRGLEVWLAARRKAELEEQVRLIDREGGLAHALVLDISRADDTQKRLAELDEEVGGIDLCVANAAIAGLPAAIPVSRASWEEVRDVLNVNLLGNVATVMPFIPRMIARGHGHIVGISSLLADVPVPRAAQYGASKAGLSHFLDAAGIELRPLGVDVTVVHPGFIRTPAAAGVSEPMPFILETDKAARIIDAAIQRRARKIRFPAPLAALQVLPQLLPGVLADPLLRYISREPTPPGER